MVSAQFSKFHIASQRADRYAGKLSDLGQLIPASRRGGSNLLRASPGGVFILQTQRGHRQIPVVRPPATMFESLGSVSRWTNESVPAVPTPAAWSLLSGGTEPSRLSAESTSSPPIPKPALP